MMISRLLEAGKIANTHGVRGEVKIQPWCDGAEFLLDFDTLYIGGEPFKAQALRVHKGNVIAKLEGIDDIGHAITLKNRIVEVDVGGVKLEEGSYFISDLIGAKVVEAGTGRALGRLKEVITRPGNDVYVVDGENGELLIPAVGEFIKEIDAAAAEIKVKLIEGM